MSNEGISGSGTIARGLAVIAWLATLLLAGQHLVTELGPRPSAAVPTCATPIEIVSPAGPRLACADDPALAACAPVRAGDQVTLPGCEISAMSAAARLLEGLPLDLNRATAADLRMLDGVGPKRAAAIIAERSAGGPFGSLADLTRVRGIGEKTVKALAPFVAVPHDRPAIAPSPPGQSHAIP